MCAISTKKCVYVLKISALFFYLYYTARLYVPFCVCHVASTGGATSQKVFARIKAVG